MREDKHPGGPGTNPALSIPGVSTPGNVHMDEPDETPDYVSRHIDCPDCGQAMILYSGKWMCGCGHEESCCD